MTMDLRPPVLDGTYIRLEPLTQSHHADLCRIGLDPAMWKYTTTDVRTPEDLKAYIETALQWQRQGIALPFAIVEKSSGLPIGSTRYAAIDGEHRRLEIGWTWVGTAWQRTPVNTEAKYLLLVHAFERMGCIRVEFKTDSLNEASRKALRRIGATEEGTLRKHMVMPSGRNRHSVYYSILDEEWPRVKTTLEEFLKRPFARSARS